MQDKLNAFITQYAGQIVTFDGIAEDSGQCVQLVELWCHSLGTAVEWENAGDWWYDYGGAFAGSWDKIPNDPTNPSQVPGPGDIVVFAKDLPGSGGDGHIDIFSHVINTDSWTGFDSNWSSKAASLITHNWKYVLGWFTLKTPVVAVPPFTTDVGVFSGQFTVNPGVHKWNLDLATFDDIDNNPVAYTPPSPITFTAKLTRSDIPQYTYYLEDSNVHQGYNSLDVTPYAAPVPVPATPSIVASAAAPKAPAPKMYDLLTQVRWYKTSSDAQFRKNPMGAIASSHDYYQFGTGESTVYLGTDNMHAMYWINTSDNVAPIVIPVTPMKPSQVPISGANDVAWKATYRSFHADRTSDPYLLLQDVTMKEYSGKRNTVQLYKGKPINLVGTFEKSGVVFYRARDFKNDEYFDWYYGISMYNDEGQANVAKVTEDVAEIAERKLRDYRAIWKDDLKDIWDIIAPKFLRKKG